MQKYDNKKRKLSAAYSDVQHMMNPPKKGRPKRIDFWNEIPTFSHTTKTIQKEHIVQLQKECTKTPSIQDTGMIKELMNATYKLRRRDILTTTMPVNDIILQYPPLATVNGVYFLRLQKT